MGHLSAVNISGKDVQVAWLLKAFQLDPFESSVAGNPFPQMIMFQVLTENYSQL